MILNPKSQALSRFINAMKSGNKSAFILFDKFVKDNTTSSEDRYVLHLKVFKMGKGGEVIESYSSEKESKPSDIIIRNATPKSFGVKDKSGLLNLRLSINSE